MIASQKYTIEDIRWTIGRVNDPDALFTYLLAAILTDELKATPMYLEYTPGFQTESTDYKIVGFTAIPPWPQDIRGDRRPSPKLVALIDEPDFGYEYMRVSQNPSSCDATLYMQNIGFKVENQSPSTTTWPTAVRRQDWTTVVRRTLALQEFWNVAFPPAELATQVFEPGQKVYWTRVLTLSDFPVVKQFRVVSQGDLRIASHSNEAVDTLIQPLQAFYGQSSGVLAVHSRELMTEDQFRKLMDNPGGNVKGVQHENSPWFEENVIKKMPPEIIRPY